jgi:hypothetical protein
MEQIVEKYIQLRDIKSLMKQKYEAKVAKVDAIMEKIEGVILQQFNEQGMTSCGTKMGTAYKQLQARVSVADWDLVLKFIKEHGMWQMLERRIGKVAVVEYKEAHGGELPPGLNFSEEYVVNIRRAS